MTYWTSSRPFCLIMDLGILGKLRGWDMLRLVSWYRTKTAKGFIDELCRVRHDGGLDARRIGVDVDKKAES
jgi:hypothetical protein